MATRKITKKVKVVEPDLTNPIYTHEWSVEDNTDYASINDFYLTYNNVNYYFTKPNTIEIGDKFYFNINTKVLKLNEDTISTSTTGSSNNELIFVPPHKWSDEYINIGANAQNVFLEDESTMQEFVNGTLQIYKTGLILQTTSPETFFDAYKGKEIWVDIDETVPCFLNSEIFSLEQANYPYGFFFHINKFNGALYVGIPSIVPFGYDGISYSPRVKYGQYPNNEGTGWYIVLNKLYYQSEYIDEHFGHLEGDFVQKTGDIMTGPLTATELTIGTRKTENTIGDNSFAQGIDIIASGRASHAEGQSTTSGGTATHAEGISTSAYGDFSHAEGYNTGAYRKSQHVEGEYNIIDTSGGNQSQKGDYVHIVGNGTANNSRSNAYTLDWSGNAWFAGDVYIGSTSGTNKDAGSKKLTTLNNTFKFTDRTGETLSKLLIDNNNVIHFSNDTTTGDICPPGLYLVTGWYMGTYGNMPYITPNPDLVLVTEDSLVSLFSNEGYAKGIYKRSPVEGTKFKVTSLSSSSTNTQYPSAKCVYDEINTKISSVYKAKGTCTFANKPALQASNEGFVYNISDAFTTTSDFVEGSGKSYPAGTNIIIINNGTTANPSWKYDVLAGMTDLSGYVAKAGDTMTGTLKLSSGDLKVVTGTIHGEDNGTASYTNHAIKLGHAQQDYCNFYEYGGVFNFYKSMNGTDTLLGKITTNGWEGKALLDTGSTAITQPIDTNNTTIATTAFVKSVTQNMITYGAAEPTGSFTAPAGSLYCVYA